MNESEQPHEEPTMQDVLNAANEVMEQLMIVFPRNLDPVEQELRELALAGRNYWEFLVHGAPARIGNTVRECLMHQAVVMTRSLVERAMEEERENVCSSNTPVVD